MSFKKFLQNIKEETAVADIATVDTKLDLRKRDRKRSGGKKCKLHKRSDCIECQEDKYT